jgi:AbiU2
MSMSFDPPSTPADDTDLMALVNPVWSNTYWVKSALELYEGITKHVDALKMHAHFFALVQKFSMDAAVLGICKLFDRSNPQFEKNTVPSLLCYLRDNLTDAYIARIDLGILTALGMELSTAETIVTNIRQGEDFTITKNALCESLQKLVPISGQCPSLAKLMKYRNKIAVHQERVSDAIKEEMKYLPSLTEMEMLNTWAINFCLLIVSAMSNTSLIMGGPSARISALNVVATILGKNFDGVIAHQAERDFYERL